MNVCFEIQKWLDKYTRMWTNFVCFSISSLKNTMMISNLIAFKNNNLLKFQTFGSTMESPHVSWTRSLPQSPSGSSLSLALLNFSSTENTPPQSVSYSKHLQLRQGFSFITFLQTCKLWILTQRPLKRAKNNTSKWPRRLNLELNWNM